MLIRSSVPLVMTALALGLVVGAFVLVLLLRRRRTGGRRVRERTAARILLAAALAAGVLITVSALVSPV